MTAERKVPGTDSGVSSAATSTDEWVAATEERNEIPESGFTRTIRVAPHTRLFRVSDELAANALLDWSPPVQLKMHRNEDGSYELVARTVPS